MEGGGRRGGGDSPEFGRKDRGRKKRGNPGEGGLSGGSPLKKGKDLRRNRKSLRQKGRPARQLPS